MFLGPKIGVEKVENRPPERDLEVVLLSAAKFGRYTRNLALAERRRFAHGVPMRRGESIRHHQSRCARKVGRRRREETVRPEVSGSLPFRMDMERGREHWTDERRGLDVCRADA